MRTQTLLTAALLGLVALATVPATASATEQCAVHDSGGYHTCVIVGEDVDDPQDCRATCLYLLVTWDGDFHPVCVAPTTGNPVCTLPI